MTPLLFPRPLSPFPFLPSPIPVPLSPPFPLSPFPLGSCELSFTPAPAEPRSSPSERFPIPRFGRATSACGCTRPASIAPICTSGGAITPRRRDGPPTFPVSSTPVRSRRCAAYSRWKVGDRVMGLVGGGAQAEMVAVHQDEALPIPDGLSYAEAAAIPEAFLTAYDALVTRARLAPGERVLIHAVGSGVGTAATQIAQHLGATVLGTSRSAEKIARATVYGLDHGIDTSRRSFREAVGEPVNVILDVLGGHAFADNLAVLAPRGRLVLIGFLTGSTLQRRPRAHPAQASRDHRDDDAHSRARGARPAGARVHRADASSLRSAYRARGAAPARGGTGVSDGGAGRRAPADGKQSRRSGRWSSRGDILARLGQVVVCVLPSRPFPAVRPLFQPLEARRHQYEMAVDGVVCN